MSDQKQPLMSKKWASEAERSRSRRAYQRAWRNKRNWDRHVNAAADELEKARRSYELYDLALRELV